MTYAQLVKAFQQEGPVSIVVDLARIARVRAHTFARCSDQDSKTHWESVATMLEQCARDMTQAA